MKLNFTYTQQSIRDDTYGIKLKARRCVKKALLQYYPTHIFILPQSLSNNHHQGFSFEQILNTELEITIPSISSSDPYLLGQQQNELGTLNHDIENTLRHFMKESPTTRYSDKTLVITRIDRSK